jgi:hypothetical protein
MAKGQSSKRLSNSCTIAQRSFHLPCGKHYCSQNVRMVSKLVKLHKKTCEVCQAAHHIKLGSIDTDCVLDQQSTQLLARVEELDRSGFRCIPDKKVHTQLNMHQYGHTIFGELD